MANGSSENESESVVRLRQENREQDLVISELNDRVHSLLKQRGNSDNEGQKMA